MFDRSKLRPLNRDELEELILGLIYRANEVPKRAIAEARWHAATRRAERATAATEEALKDYVRLRGLHDRAVAERRPPGRLSADLAGAAAKYKAACTAERKAFAAVGHRHFELEVLS